MSKQRLSNADALARLLFAKPLEELDPAERANLELLRALDEDALDEKRYQELAAQRPEEGGDNSLH
jgi:hypothetical protein